MYKEVDARLPDTGPANPPDDWLGLRNTGHPLPFEDLFLPLVFAAREKLRAQVESAIYDLLTPTAHAGWERYLLTRLVRAGAKAAHRQFQVYQEVSQVFPSGFSSSANRLDTFYRSFVGDDPSSRLQKLFGDYPGLDRLCRILVTNWLSAVAEFLRRLAVDRHQLGVLFGEGTSFASVTSVTTGLSDPHRGGRCVARVTFDGGVSLFYKPRSIAPERCFSQLIDWVNTDNVPFLLKAAKCWEREDYGWMEEIVAAACSTLEEISAFYWRAGALMGLVFLAQGVDMHQQNLIASSAFPVLIDLETLLHPQDHIGISSHEAVGSVLRTGFLPDGAINGRQIYEWSVLNHHTRAEHAGPGWININEDEMAWSAKKIWNRERAYLPVLDGNIYPAKGCVCDILAGFRWVGSWLLPNEGSESNSFNGYKLWVNVRAVGFFVRRRGTKRS